MNFISLHDLMDKRADEIQPPRYSDPDFAIEARYSEAAATFHQALLNTSGSRPRWFKIHDKTRLPTVNVEAATEGLRILEHMAGAFSRRVRARNNHIRDCINGGLDPATAMMGYNLNDLMYRGPDMFLAQEIGFDYKEIMEFFNSTVNTELQVDECPDYVQGQSQVKANAAKSCVDDRERSSQLHCLIWRVYQYLVNNQKKVTAQKVWNEIQHRYKDHDKDGIIQEVTAELIEWCSGYGYEQKLKRSTFDKTLSTLKTNPPF